MGLTLRLNDRLNPDLGVGAAVQALTTRSRIHLSRVWCLPRSLIGHVACEAYWILLLMLFEAGHVWF